MSRLDWHIGRFKTDEWEVYNMHQALRGFQATEVYDEVTYYRFSHEKSQMDDIYDEGFGVGKVFRPGVIVPTLHVNHIEGARVNTDRGFYFNDDIYITLSFDQAYRTGLVFQDIRTSKYDKDRLVYDNRVFNVTNVQIEGQVRQRDLIVAITGTCAKPDELVNDPQFAAYIQSERFTDGDIL